MDYNIKKKLYNLDFVAETKDGEVVTGTITATTSRQLELQVRHYYPDVAQLQSFSCTPYMCSMSAGEFFENSVKTKIGG